MDSLLYLAAQDATAAADSIQPTFNMLSWGVVLFYLIFTTWLGHVLSGKQATIRDFFLGGRKLPWYAVSGSIVATELSAMTLVGVPAFLWAETGNMTYAILAVGNIVSRILVSIYFIPKFYEEEIYSPYDYIGNRLGKHANNLTSLLFMLGGILGQGTRVFLTAVVLNVIIDIPFISNFTPEAGAAGLQFDAELVFCIWVVGLVSVIWTWLGGIATVIWTDVILFLIFTFSAVVTIIIAVSEFTSAGFLANWSEIWALGVENEKTTIVPDSDTWFDLKSNYTPITAIAASIVGVAAYGTDQLMAQRCFCCKNQHEAKKALIWSSVSQILMYLCLLMGLALWAYYKFNENAAIPAPEEVAQIDENANRLLPVFIRYRAHWFIGGLMIAGIFAAAISSLDSILAALSQQTLAGVHRMKGLSPDDHRPGDIALSRIFIIVWAILLCGMATAFHVLADNATLLIELALGVVGYVQGGILGAFLLALIPSIRVKAKGMEVPVILSVLSVVGITRHGSVDPSMLFGSFAGFSGLNEAGQSVMNGDAVALLIGCAGLFVWACIRFLPEGKIFSVAATAVYVAVILTLNRLTFAGAEGPEYLLFGWPWYAPIGLVVMITSALLTLERQKPEDYT